MPDFSEHALKRMKERGITEHDVNLALSRPIGGPQPGKLGTIIRRGHGVGGKIIKLYLSAANPDYVITVAEEI